MSEPDKCVIAVGSASNDGRVTVIVCEGRIALKLAPDLARQVAADLILNAYRAEQAWQEANDSGDE